MKKKLLFLALSILTVFTLVFVTLNNRFESDENYIQEVDVIESLEKDDCAYFANLIYDDGSSSWNENTAIGGAIGLIISCAIADSIKSSSSVSVGSGASGNEQSAVPTGKNVTFDDILNLPDIADKRHINLKLVNWKVKRKA